MKSVFKWLALLVALGCAAALVAALGVAGWYVYTKLPQRDGMAQLKSLQAPVTVRYDARGVPHISAQNEADMYRALGYVQAQDRLFQMEMLRRLAQGELAEILGPDLLPMDRLFRTLGIRAHAKAVAADMDASSPAVQALDAYLSGINSYQAQHTVPMEFDLLDIPKRPFTRADVVAVSGYLAYSFATAFRSDPALTLVRDKLGPDYLRIFDLEWQAQGVLAPSSASRTSPSHWASLDRWTRLSQQALATLHLPQWVGSNAWAVSGARTASGKPLLAGDPHVEYAAPGVWYEAHLSAPGFELYGQYLALYPMALLGHNPQFGWNLTLLQNDDVDLIAEKTDAEHPNQVWYQGSWVGLSSRAETIQVKGEDPVRLVLRRGPHGPLITDAFPDRLGSAPVALWWAYLETENPLLDAFYALNRADTPAKVSQAASQIHAPGMNIVWANQGGHIGWWAAAKLPIRPDGVSGKFILDGASAESDKLGYYRFSDNPHELDPARGYVLNANQQPLASSGVPIPGYYKLPDRAQRLDALLRNDQILWTVQNSQALQLDGLSTYGPRVLQALAPVLDRVVTDPQERFMLASLKAWDGQHALRDITPTVFNQLLYELAFAALADELPAAQFQSLLRTPALEFALPRLGADADSPWWDNVTTPEVEHRDDTVRAAWRATLAHLETSFGKNPTSWGWGQAHTLTHKHPLAKQWPLTWLLNVGPFDAPGGRETPNNLSGAIGPAPWAVAMGPSTRRLLDFGDASVALGMNPLGQSGVWLDRHRSDQAQAFINGEYAPLHLSEADVAANTRSTLVLKPAVRQ